MPRTIGHLLNKLATIERPTSVEQGAGYVESPETIATNVPCRRAPAGAGDQELAASIEVVVDHVIYFNPDTNVRRDDEITIKGRRYEVRHVTEPSEEIYLKAFVEERQTGL